MQIKHSLLFLLFSFLGFGQNTKEYPKQLEGTFLKFVFYANPENQKSEKALESMEKFDESFERLLLQFTSTVPESIKWNSKILSDNHLNISTSEDKLFRIYSWDDETGGTMRNFKNVYQYINNNKTFSIKLPEKDNDNAFCEIVDQIKVENKTFYIVKSVFIGSSALSYHKIKIFSIENSKLNFKAKLIKTKTGIRNELGYEIDFSSSANRSNESVNYDDARLEYDKKNKIILLPLIQADGKLTKQKIRYQFKGKYFEKI